MKILVIVDMQKDFIDGSLGSKEAQAIIPNAVEKIKNWDGKIFVTYDTHSQEYLNTKEGKKLPIEHCIYNTEGHKINDEIEKALCEKYATDDFKNHVVTIYKNTFGSTSLPKMITETITTEETINESIDLDEPLYIEFVGLCTDICVVSNVLITKANFINANIVVDASCCAGVTPEKHKAALEVMKSCQIDIINE